MKVIQIFLSIAIICCSAWGWSQDYVVTFPLNNSKNLHEESVIVIRANGESSKTDFTIESDIFSTIDFDFEKSASNGIVNLIPTSAFFLGDHIRVRNQNNDVLVQFDIRTRKANFISDKEENVYAIDKAIPAFTIDSNITTSTGPIFFRNSGTPGDKYMGIMNSDGSEIFSQAENQVQNFDLQPSGYLSYYDKVDEWFLLMDSAYTIIDTIQGASGLIADFHEFIHLANGNSLLMSEDPQTTDLSSFGGLSNATVVGNVIQIIDDNDVLLFNWRSWDYINLTETSSLLTTSNVDYVHVNAIDYDLDGNLIISARNLNQVYKIHISTGDFMWRLGGSMGDLTVINDPDQLSLQHDCRILPDGHLTVFDNGVNHSTPLAKAKEYVIDTAANTATLIWSYAHPYGQPSSKTGNVQRLANGNTFINWGDRGGDLNNPNFTEVNSLGEIVYQFRFTAAASYSCYRARRHAWDIVSAISEREQVKISLFPNPATDFISFSNKQRFDLVLIFDVHGKLILKQENANEIIIQSLNPGLYFLQAYSGEDRFNSKFVKQ